MNAANFIPGVWDAAIKKSAAATSATWGLLQTLSRSGHSEPAQTDREWDQLRTARNLAYNKWRKLTDELLTDGTLEYGHCYECAGELELGKDRPTNWVWDETEEEHTARLKSRLGDI
jgi:hypothetical protein